MATSNVTQEKPANGTETQAEQTKPQIVVQPQRQMTRFGVVPHNFDEAWRMSVAIAKSDLAPKDFRDKPENCFIALQMGAEVGLPPMAAIQNIAVINGRPSLWGDAALAVVIAHPDYEHHEEYLEGTGDSLTAVFEIQRRGHKPHKVTFSVDDAKKAKLWTKTGPWQEYPKRMLQMRARGFGLRNKFPDALKGLNIAEEAMDLPPVAVQVPSGMPELPAEIKRASDTARDVPAANQEELNQKLAADREIMELIEQVHAIDQNKASELLSEAANYTSIAQKKEMAAKVRGVLEQLKAAKAETCKGSKKEKVEQPTGQQLFGSIVND
jgi:hypothetical protein